MVRHRSFRFLSYTVSNLEGLKKDAICKVGLPKEWSERKFYTLSYTFNHNSSNWETVRGHEFEIEMTWVESAIRKSRKTNDPLGSH